MAKKKNRLVLKRETAIKVFEGLGFKTVSKWNNERLRKKVSNLPELVDGVKSKDKWMRKALVAIQAADKVVLAKTEGEQQKDTKKGVDGFGRRLGTQGALIDAALGKGGKSVAVIAKETKLSSQRVGVHLNDLHKRGLIVKDEKGRFSIK